MRAADNDRQAIVEQLARAQAEGRLDLVEFDDRVHRAWSAQTYADLAVLTADLPTDDNPVPRPPQPAYQHQPQTYQHRPQTYRHATHLPEPERENKAARLFFRAWVAASMINFVIWGLVSVTTFELVYPWWIWVVGPWGALILAGRMTRFGQQG